MVRSSQVCTVPGCPEFVESDGRCTGHQREGFHTSTRVKPPGWGKVRGRVLRRDRRRCVICGERATVVDHLLPIAWGGTEDMGNLRAMCGPCHRAKTAMEQRIGKAGRPPEQVAAFLGEWQR